MHILIWRRIRTSSKVPTTTEQVITRFVGMQQKTIFIRTLMATTPMQPERPIRWMDFCKIKWQQTVLYTRRSLLRRRIFIWGSVRTNSYDDMFGRLMCLEQLATTLMSRLNTRQCYKLAFRTNEPWCWHHTARHGGAEPEDNMRVKKVVWRNSHHQDTEQCSHKFRRLRKQ
jgi:hypothetical protein